MTCAAPAPAVDSTSEIVVNPESGQSALSLRAPMPALPDDLSVAALTDGDGDLNIDGSDLDDEDDVFGAPMQDVNTDDLAAGCIKSGPHENSRTAHSDYMAFRRECLTAVHQRHISDHLAASVHYNSEGLPSSSAKPSACPKPAGPNQPAGSPCKRRFSGRFRAGPRSLVLN